MIRRSKPLRLHPFLLLSCLSSAPSSFPHSHPPSLPCHQSPAPPLPHAHYWANASAWVCTTGPQARSCCTCEWSVHGTYECTVCVSAASAIKEGEGAAGETKGLNSWEGASGLLHFRFSLTFASLLKPPPSHSHFHAKLHTCMCPKSPFSLNKNKRLLIHLEKCLLLQPLCINLHSEEEEKKQLCPSVPEVNPFCYTASLNTYLYMVSDDCSLL